MSRREIALNVFLGAVLLFVPVIILAVAWAGFMLVFRALDRVLLYFFPSALHHIDPTFLLGVIVLGSAAWSLHRRYWHTAFVEFAASICLTLVCLHQIQSKRDIHLPWYFVVLLGLTLVSPPGPKQDMARRRFLLANTLLGLATMSVLGFLGSLSNLVNIFLFVIATGLWVIEHQADPIEPGTRLSTPTP